MLRCRVRVAGELHDHGRQADALHAKGRPPGVTWIKLKPRRGGHGVALLRRAARMLEEKADVLRLQRLVVDLQLVEQSAQVGAHVAPGIRVAAAADPQHAVRRIGLQREIAALGTAQDQLTGRELGGWLLALTVHIEREMRFLRRPIRDRDVMPLAVIWHEPVRCAEVSDPLALALAIDSQTIPAEEAEELVRRGGLVRSAFEDHWHLREVVPHVDPGRDGEVAAEVDRRRIRQLDTRVDLLDHHGLAGASGRERGCELGIDRSTVVLTGRVFQVAVEAEVRHELRAGGGK